MITIKTEEEIGLLRENNLLVSATLAEVAKHVAPGVTTLELDRIAEEFIRSHGAVPGFLGYGGFPNTLCVSVNEQVVHGIPSDYALREGDVVSVDCGTVMKGFYGDSAYTFAVGSIDPQVAKLLQVTKEALYKGVAQAKAATASEISLRLCSNMPNRTAFRWCANWWGTGSAGTCMKTRRYPITEPADAARCSRREWSSASNP